MASNRNYSVNVPGGYQTITGETNPVDQGFTVVLDARSGQRTGGTDRRRKPIGKFLKPTDYSMMEVSNVRARGYAFIRVKADPSQSILRTGSGLSITSVSSMANSTAIATGVTETFPSNLAQRALSDARLRLKGNSINLGQAYAERSQTARLVVDSLERVAGACLALRKGNIRRFYRLLRFGNPSRQVVRRVKRTLRRKGLPKTWLEYQYGWKPLLSDIHGAVTALDNRDRSEFWITVKGSAVEQMKGSAVEGGGISKRSSTVDILHGSFVRIDACPSSSALATAAELGLTNPVALAWELLPFSFVVDWALPLGDYFAQLDALNGWEIKGFSQSNLTRGRWRWTGVSSDSASNTVTNSWIATRNYVKLDRGTNGGVVPFPVFPRPKDPFNSKEHVASALSLLATVFNWRS